MKFSIVITTYNRLALLKRAIHSALNQTVACEVVVADDGSTDGTAEYVQQLSQQLAQTGNLRLVYHRNAKNSGHSATMNAGVAVATGDWIKPVDDDDYLHSQCIATMTEAIAAHEATVVPQTQSQAVLCSCQAAQVDPDGTELSLTRIIGPGKVFYISQADIHYGMLLEQLPFGTPIQVAFRRDMFLKSGGWDSSLDANCDDIDSWIKLAQYGDGIFINQCLAYRTIWPGAYNQTFSLKKRLETNILMKEKIYALVDEQYQQDIPKLEQIKKYLKLHWGLVALKKAKAIPAAQLANSALFCLPAWQILLASIARRQLQKFPDLSAIFGADDPEPVQQSNRQHNFEVQFSPTQTQQETVSIGHTQLLVEPVLSLLQSDQSLQDSNHPLTVTEWAEFFKNERLFLDHQSKLNRNYIQELHCYLKVRCVYIAFKQGKLLDVINLLVPVLFSFSSWKYLISLIILQQQALPDLQKPILIPASTQSWQQPQNQYQSH